MKSLITFYISALQSINILLDEQNKINTYGYKTKRLHVFDEVEVGYVHDGKMIILAKDIVREIVSVFFALLRKSLKNELALDQSFGIGKVGYFFSNNNYMATDESDEPEKKDDIFSQYWVWSSPDNIQTWLYNMNGKIYLEISPTYPWLFADPEEGESYISFNEYINNYKPIAIIELQEPLVRTWINQCRDILQAMETV